MAADAKKQRRQQPTLVGLTVEGFKSLRDKTSIEVRPLTILAGANSAGKSSIIQPLLLLKQTLEAPFDPGPLLLDGPNVRFTEASQLLWRGLRPAGRSHFTVSVQVSKHRGLRLTFAVGGAEPLSIHKQECDGVTLNGGDVGKEASDSLPPKMRKLSRELFTSVTLTRDRCFLLLQQEPKRIRSLDMRKAFQQAFPIYRFPHRIPEVLLDLIHLPGLRGNPERSYRLAAPGNRFPGLFQEYVASLLAQWKKRDPERMVTLRDALERLGLTWKVDIRPVDDTRAELLVGRLPHAKRGGARDLVNIADVGFGVSQSLPVLVALVAAAKGQVVYLEQPEIHLHPRAQVALTSLLAETAKRGVTLIVETHSSLLLRSVQALVAKGELPPVLVKLHWFTRGTNGATKVESADLDEDGAFGDWPEDFGRVELDAEREYLDAVSERGG